jgi:type III secretion system YscI/HrpB-like protein
MTEPMIVEAIRAAGTNAAMPATAMQVDSAMAATAVADPNAVSRFDAVMNATPVPFASEVSSSFSMAEANNQGILHRINALCELKSQGDVAAAELLELQYEVMNLSFQQEVVTKVADKASSAIQTLIKNQ